MRKVHTAASILDVAHLRNLLEQEGIACCVRNERLAGGLGEIPFVECWPELWVLRNGDELRARGVIDGLLRDMHAPQGPNWRCEGCGEWVEAQFAECWRCAGNATGEAT